MILVSTIRNLISHTAQLISQWTLNVDKFTSFNVDTLTGCFLFRFRTFVFGLYPEKKTEKKTRKIIIMDFV